jgi:hypothetical protein
VNVEHNLQPLCPANTTRIFLHLQIAECGVLPLLRKSFAANSDIFLVNFGSWHRRSSGDWTDYYTALRHLGEYYQVMVKHSTGLLMGTEGGSHIDRSIYGSQWQLWHLVNAVLNMHQLCCILF